MLLRSMLAPLRRQRRDMNAVISCVVSGFKSRPQIFVGPNIVLTGESACDSHAIASPVALKFLHTVSNSFGAARFFA